MKIAKRLAITILLLAAPALAEMRSVTLDDVMKFRSIIDVKISPDGARVAYVLSTPNVTKNEHEVALYIVPVGGGQPQRLAESLRIFNTPLPRASLRWSPDSAAIAVLGFAENRPQVFAISTTTVQLTSAAEGVSAYDWSPDGNSIAYITRDPMSAEDTRQRQTLIRVDAPERPGRLVVKPLDGNARTLTPAAHYVDSFSWSPDGRELAYSAADRSGFSAQYRGKIYAVAAAGGEPRALVDRTGMNTRPQFSPDGRLIAFISTNGRANIMASRSLAFVSARGGEPRIVPMDDAWINDFLWARDSRSIYAIPSDGTFASRENMFEQPIVRVWVDGLRSALAVPRSNPVNYSLSLSNDGKRLAFRSVHARSMGDVYVADTATGKTTRLTHVNPELKDLALGELKAVTWRSFDEMQIWGLLLTPPGYKEGRLPMLVYVHGGPGGGVTYGLFPQFMHVVGQVDPYPTEALASAGFAILFPMPRGGSGYGEAGQRAIVNAWGEADYRDIMIGVDEMVRRGIADPDRLGVMGASYGGYMTNWIVTQTNRFKAASSAASISDLADMFYLSDGGETMIDYFQRPWENRESYAAHSPITFVERVTTPLLIQHGERDARVPIAGAWRFYRALKALGKPVEFDIYPRGGHVMYEPSLQREVMRRNLEWFARWISNPVIPSRADGEESGRRSSTAQQADRGADCATPSGARYLQD